MLCTIALHQDDPLNKPPKQSELANLVSCKAKDKWEVIGILLDIEQHELNAISQSRSDPLVCYSKVFRMWKATGDPPFTWATILDVLRSPAVAEISLASEIERRLKTQ